LLECRQHGLAVIVRTPVSAETPTMMGDLVRVPQSLRRRGSSIVVASIGRQVLPVTDTETAPSLLWFATIQCIESEQDPAGLAPQSCFISAEAVECEVGQIGETQKATREVSVGFNGRFDRPWVGFCSVGDVVRRRVDTGRISPPE
jgi:hypothetical protein